MSEPLFLSFEDILVFHRRSLAEFGGIDGIRDEGLLQSAVMQPQHTFFYGGGDLFDVAAAYAFHIAEAQAFLDGNKRTAVAAALAFLHMNGMKRVLDWTQIYEAMIAIAERRMNKNDLAALFRRLTSEAKI